MFCFLFPTKKDSITNQNLDISVDTVIFWLQIGGFKASILGL